jgi:hypothetical protein
MTQVKIYLDEDVHDFIADALRLRGWDALTTVEAGNRSKSDPDQIHFATEQGFAIVTYNVQDYPRLHYELINAGSTHAGIIVAPQQDPRRNIRALFNLLSSVPVEKMKDQLVYLSNWW